MAGEVAGALDLGPALVMHNPMLYRAFLYLALAAFTVAAGSEWAGPTPLVVVIGFVGACIGLAACLKFELKKMAARKQEPSVSHSREQEE